MTTPRILTVRTRLIHEVDPLWDQPLLDLLPDDSPMSWVTGDEGLVGWGVAARLDTSGPERFSEAESWWNRVHQRMDVDDEVRLPGSGPVAFTSMAFADSPGRSVMVVPEVVVGQRDGVRWITTVGDADPKRSDPVRSPGEVQYDEGQLSAEGYRSAIAEAVRRMCRPDGIGKVVLARDLVATTSRPVDTRFLLHRLARRHPDCWTFSVDGLVGATPELLLERAGDQVRSRVLAGTAWPRDGVSADALAEELFDSRKNRGEHHYAVDSLASGLGPFCRTLAVPGEPEVLRLRNVMHLATNVSGTLHPDGPSVLRMLAAVHPTAAVGGSPTADAVDMIGELEGMDRERYSGPVGWVDGEGNGEFGIALRCAQLEDSRRLRLFAGCGIVADSDPDSEVLEANAKFLPLREALEHDGTVEPG